MSGVQRPAHTCSSTWVLEVVHSLRCYAFLRNWAALRNDASAAMWLQQPALLPDGLQVSEGQVSCTYGTCTSGSSTWLLDIKQGNRKLAAEQQLTGDQQTDDSGAYHHNINIGWGCCSCLGCCCHGQAVAGLVLPAL